MTHDLRAGHRDAAHTADLRIEAWAPTRERCIAEAVSAMVESFAGGSLPTPNSTIECNVTGSTDENLLVAVLDEAIYRMETTGEIPTSTEILATPEAVRARFSTVEAATVIPTGSIPKAVSLHELRVEPNPDGWSCSVTIDVWRHGTHCRDPVPVPHPPAWPDASTGHRVRVQRTATGCARGQVAGAGGERRHAARHRAGLLCDA
ncbi:archease [Qaidamihabitans albus]|uniref:archease n=1 Tax=Qaidamihabitans albus TaxID=2795733 RepID=UPI0027DD2C6D|nr:archease [Qaidamihabitans albus]